ncbi:MAG TPA: DUF2723 domain-containing protein [Chloroflexota bacterium]
MPFVLGLGALALYVSAAAPTLSVRNGGDDGGDLAVAAASLGVAHPTGYPLYVVVGWTWLHVVQLGDVAYRLNLLSGVSAALAMAATAWGCVELIRLLRPGTERLTAAAGAAAATGLLAASEPLWGQAVVISVYTLNLAFAAVGLGLIARGQRVGASAPGAALLGLLLGIGLGNHLTLAFVGLAAIVAAIFERWSWRVWLAAVGCAAIGLALVYGYLLLGRVASRDPIGAWGDPSSWPGFVALISGQMYHGLVGRPPIGQIVARLPRAAGLALGVLTPVGLAAAIVAMVDPLKLAPERSLRGLLASLSLAGAALLFAITYGGARGEHHLLLLYLALTPLAAVGFTDLLGHASIRWRPVLVVALCCLVAGSGWWSRGAGAAGDSTARDAAVQELQAQPPNGRLAPQSDAETFGLWYAQEVLGVRPDVAVVHPGLWQASPTYRAKLLAKHPLLAAG